MFKYSYAVFIIAVLGSCDSSRIIEQNHDFDGAQWSLSDTLDFRFTVPDTTSQYNVMMNVRNTIDFKTARFFVQYELKGSDQTLRKRLVEENLFDRKTGKPFGESGLGNIYSHQFFLERSMMLKPNTTYIIKLNHMMRDDTLTEMQSVGIRIERANQ